MGRSHVWGDRTYGEATHMGRPDIRGDRTYGKTTHNHGMKGSGALSNSM